MSTAWILILGTAGGIFLSTITGCGAGHKPFADYPEECQMEALTKISASYAAELLWACKSYEDLDSCPGAAAVDENFAAQYDEWEMCRSTRPGQ